MTVTEPDARAARIEAIYRRGLATQQQAFDPGRHLVSQGPVRPGGPRTYRPPQSLWLAFALLREGGAEGERTAAAIVSAALDSQMLAPNHPHRGNFLWLAGDEEVVDLNAVQFMLRALLPLLVEHGDRLPPDVLARSRESLRLALAEQERMAVAPTYTNIHLMALFSLLIGGEWLGDTHFQALGRQRWQEWVRFTAQSGAPHEYNSPGYGGVDLSALAALHQYTRDATVKLQARLMYERLWLHLALHLHPATGRHAGPHCRNYWGQMMSGHSALHDLLWREMGWDGQPDSGVREAPASIELAVTAHWLPDPLRAWLAWRETAPPYEVRETANRHEGADLTTYFTPEYALGTASRTYSIGQDDFYIEHQSNYCILHYRRQSDWGMVYSRYVVNDRHYGMLTAAPDRPPNAFYDQGNFAGVQLRNKAIALYALQPQYDLVHSLKTVVVFPWVDRLDEVWLDDRRVRLPDLPLSVPAGQWLVVADGAVYVGVRALEPSCLGRDAPIILERGPQGELWLTIFNYRGPAKRFWDYASLRGAFWRGNLRAGYILEVAGRDEYDSTAAFLAHLHQAEVRDTVAETDASPVVRTVVYRSGGDAIEVSYDLWWTQPLGRRLNGASYVAPALSSPLAVQGDSGRLVAGSATLETNPQMVWLIAQERDPAARCWVVVNPEDRPTPLRLETPCGVVSAERWGLGRLEWRAPVGGRPSLAIDALEPPVGLRLPEGVTPVAAAPPV